MSKPLVLSRKIGDANVMMSYDEFHKDAKKWAGQKLDEEQARFEAALETIAVGVDGLVEELERTHLRLEDIKENTCAKCGLQTLKERKNRMRVFGGLFWTDSKPSPYKHCANCGHDQETPLFHPPHIDSLRRVAERRIELAHRLVGKYTKATESLNSEEVPSEHKTSKRASHPKDALRIVEETL